jgi:predicted KAP-like P-loop ATPase
MYSEKVLSLLGILLGLGLFYLAKVPIEGLLNKNLVIPIFNKMQSHFILDVTWVIALFYIGIPTCYRLRSYKPSLGIVSFWVLVTVIYIGYRFLSNEWEFTSLYFCFTIKYMDVLFCIVLSKIALHFVPNKNNNEKNGINSFFNDEPLKGNKPDKLGYKIYAEQIGDKILSSYFNTSFAIGVNGAWGAGKTSFLNLIKEKIDGADDIISIDFKPWNSYNPNAIIKDFFESFQEKISPDDSSLAKLLSEYSNKLVALNENVVTKSLQSTMQSFSSVTTANKLHEEINELLSYSNKRLVIYIDDLDRLDVEEVIEVMRLIRNTANFRNTFFVVAYDRNYLVSALKKFNSYKSENFLEKIFQTEITLPAFDKQILREELFLKLKKKLRTELHEELERSIMGGVYGSKQNLKILEDFLLNLRDVTRLANALILNLDKLRGEVIFNDFLQIELLHLKHPFVYKLLYENKSDFLSLNEHDHYVLKKRNKKEDEIKYELEYELLQKKEILGLTKKKIDLIIELLNALFSRYYRVRKNKHLSIVHPRKFKRYFSYSISSNVLSEKVFNKSLQLSQEEFHLQIDKWINSGLERELEYRYKEIYNFKSKEEFEKIITSIFYLASKPNINTVYRKQIIGYDVYDLLLKLRTNDNRLYELYSNNEDLKKVIRNILKSAIKPYLYEAHILCESNKGRGNKFPLKMDERLDICYEYFNKYLGEATQLDENIFQLFRCCKLTENKVEKIDDKIKKRMQEFCLKKDLKGFLRKIIWTDEGSFDVIKFAVNTKLIIQIFDNLEIFRREVYSLNEKNNKELKEFKIFYTKDESVNFSYVEFSFHHISINKK